MPTKQLLPEEIELGRKQAELEAKRSDLAERELELATLKAALDRFERQYIERVGKLYVELDQIEAEYLAMLAARYPANPRTQESAEESRYRAQASREEFQHKQNELPATVPEAPSDDLKALYRSLAKAWHPDGTLDLAEKDRRDALMVQINAAYKRGDLARLQALNAELGAAPEAIRGDDLGAEIIRTIRRIAQVDRRLAAIEDEAAQLRTRELFRLYEQTLRFAERGDDFLEYLEDDIKRRISHFRSQITREEGLGFQPGTAPAT